jgi:hypothetical protein
MGTDPAQNTWQGQVLHNYFQGFLIFALPHHLNIGLDIQPCRTGKSTWGLIRFLNCKCTGNGLSIFFIGGFTFTKALIIFTGKGDGTDFCAITAGSTFVRVNIAGFLMKGYFEISFRAFNRINFRTSDQVDV